MKLDMRQRGGLAALNICAGIFWLLLLFSVRAWAQEAVAPPPPDRILEGVITKVRSAGSLEVWEAEKTYPFTLYGIRLPDADTPAGRSAKKRVSDIIFNKLLFVYLYNKGGDVPAAIVVVRGDCLNEILVREGIARVADDCAISPHCDQWRIAEQEALSEATGRRATMEQGN